MKNLKINITTLCLFVTTMVFAQVTDFSAIDRNSDGMADRTEFNNNYPYSDWDANADGRVDDTEFFGSNFDRLDTNRDGNLAEAEWNLGYDNVYGDYFDNRDYTPYDTNRDNLLSREEYTKSFSNTDYYKSYDTNQDGFIDQTELSDGVFNRWDTNKDGNLDQDEYNSYSPYYINSTGDPDNFK